MPQSAFDQPTTKTIERPPCPQCKALMMLSRISPSSPGIDERTFECKCGYVEVVLVKYK